VDVSDGTLRAGVGWVEMMTANTFAVCNVTAQQSYCRPAACAMALSAVVLVLFSVVCDDWRCCTHFKM
jgi:hypothetical protein